MEEHCGSKMTSAVILALIIGGAVGYYVGANRAVEVQTVAQEEALTEEIAERANPFADQPEYQNPFSAGTNPFAQ